MCLHYLPLKAHAGAWLQPEGKGLLDTHIGRYNSENYWNADGQKRPQRTYTRWDIHPYVEYGLTSKLTVGGSAAWQHSTQGSRSSRNVVDPQAFARFSLWKDATQVVSLQPLVKFPSQYTSNTSPHGGSRSFDGELSILYGRHFKLISDHDYMTLRFGYRHRSRGLAGHYNFDAALGLQPWPKWHLTPALYVTEATSIRRAPYRQSGELDYDLIKAALSVAHQLESGNFIHASYAESLTGQQVANGQTVSLGYTIGF